MRERNAAGAIEAELRRVGFDKPAFDKIVASRPATAPGGALGSRHGLHVGAGRICSGLGRRAN